MKTRMIVPMTALALLLAACVAPMPTLPQLQLPKSEKPQLPLEQKPEANKTQLELPVLPAQPNRPRPSVFTPEQIGRTDPSSYPSDMQAVAMPQSEAVLRQMAQQQIYEAGYQPPNALLIIGRTDPSAYPAEVEQVVNSN